LQEQLRSNADTAAAAENCDFFNVLDTSGDGLLDFDEFVDGIKKLLKEEEGMDISRDTLELHFQVGATGSCSGMNASLQYLLWPAGTSMC